MISEYKQYVYVDINPAILPSEPNVLNTTAHATFRIVRLSIFDVNHSELGRSVKRQNG
jgi:hypothetical protein